MRDQSRSSQEKPPVSRFIDEGDAGAKTPRTATPPIKPIERRHDDDQLARDIVYFFEMAGYRSSVEQAKKALVDGRADYRDEKVSSIAFGVVRRMLPRHPRISSGTLDNVMKLLRPELLQFGRSDLLPPTPFGEPFEPRPREMIARTVRIISAKPAYAPVRRIMDSVRATARRNSASSSPSTPPGKGLADAEHAAVGWRNEIRSALTAALQLDMLAPRAAARLVTDPSTGAKDDSLP